MQSGVACVQCVADALCASLRDDTTYGARVSFIASHLLQ
jgi:hypothetical protein